MALFDTLKTVLTPYAEAINARESDISKLDASLKQSNMRNGIVYFPIEKGNFTASGDSDSSASVKYYCRTITGFWIDCTVDTEIVIFNEHPDRYKFSMATYDVNNKYIGATSWINEDEHHISILAGRKCRVRFTSLEANVEISVKEIYDNFTYRLTYAILQSDINRFASNWSLSNMVDRVLQTYSLPEDFATSDFPITIYTDGRKYSYKFDSDSFKTPGGSTYYCKPYDPTGVDGDGSKNNPMMLYTYLTTHQSDGDTIILMDGVYCDLAKVKNTINRVHESINIIAENAKHVIFVGNENASPSNYTWTKANGSKTYTNSNAASVKAATKIVQKFNGCFYALRQVESLSICESMEGTWYKANETSSPNIHLFGDETPTYANVFVNNITLPVLYCNSETKNIHLYIEGLIFIGGGNGGVLFRNSPTYVDPVICAVNCDFLHSYDGDLTNDAVTVLGANAYFVGCRAMYASKDGFNYHKNNDRSSNFIEINCVGANNGIDGVAEGDSRDIAYSQNGSTSHDSAKGIRINGVYYNNYGTNVTDVSGSKTINIQCSVFDSAESEGGDKYDCDCGTTTDNADSIMYLESCRCFGTKNSLYVAVGTEMHVNDSDLKGNIINNGTLYIDGVLAD